MESRQAQIEKAGLRDGARPLLTVTQSAAADDCAETSLCRIAFSTRPGDIGSSVIRTPTALAIALATAAGGGTIETSPTPREPIGWPGAGTSTMQVSIIGRSRHVG